MSACIESHDESSIVGEKPIGSDVAFETEEAPDGTLCYVDAPTAEALSKVGFPIQSFEGDGGDISYAYEVSKGTPKLKGATLTGQSMSKFIDGVAFLDAASTAYAATVLDPVPTDVPNRVLGYVRSINKHYVLEIGDLFQDNRKEQLKETLMGAGWFGLAGSIDPAFNGFADPWLMDWKPLSSYFAKFVEKENYGFEFHIPSLTGYGSQTEMLDPIDPNRKFDAIHFMASLDAGYKYTGLYLGAASTILNLDITGDFKHLTSWAGDLQTAAKDCPDPKKYSSANPLAHLESSAQEQDLLADIDAINVASNILTGTGYVHDALNNYYGSVKNMNKRCWDFVENVSGSRNLNTFEEKVYSYLGFKRESGQWKDLLGGSGVSSPKYWLMNKGLVEKTPDAEKRKTVARAFCDYVESFITVKPSC